MLSLLIFIAVQIVMVAGCGWVVARAAKAVGSSRGRWLRGALVSLAIQIISGVVIAIQAFTTSKLGSPSLPKLVALQALALVATVAVAYPILSYAFALFGRRSLAPFGAWFGWKCFEIAFALLLLKPFILEAFVMPTGSMSPTIAVDDRFTVNKLIEPRRFDIVAYRVVGNNFRAPQQEEVYCKRLIGLPGEQLCFDGSGGITINGKPLQLPPKVAGKLHAWPAAQRKSTRYVDGDPIALGSDEIFVIGDNVDLSNDSRTAGPSKRTAIVGVVDFTYFPLNRLRVFR